MLTYGSESTQRNPKLSRKLERINEQLQKGENLSEALAGDDYFPRLMPLMCRIGETSGTLPQAMGTLADYFETESKNRQSLLGVMIYPIVMTIMMIGVILLTVLYVLPSYARIFEAESLDLPLPTRILMSVSEFLPRYPWQTVGVFASVTLAICVFCGSDWGRRAIGCLKIKMPGLRAIARKRMNLRFCRSLAILLAAGEPLPQSVEMAGQTLGNPYLTPAVLSVCAALKTGRPLWVALSGVYYFDPLLVSMIQVGEETGRLPETLQKCAIYLQNETERDAAVLNRLAEPAVTLVLGLVLAFVMLSVILPTFALTGAM
jgi:type IV pilus assembly protein PilC